MRSFIAGTVLLVMGGSAAYAQQGYGYEQPPTYGYEAPPPVYGRPPPAYGYDAPPVYGHAPQPYAEGEGYAQPHRRCHVVYDDYGQPRRVCRGGY